MESESGKISVMQSKNECYLVEAGYSFITSGDKKGFSRGNYIPYPLLHKVVKDRNDIGVFCSAYRYDQVNDIDSANLYGDFYLDFDDTLNFENVRKDAITAFHALQIVFGIKEQDIRIYFSGKKGIHFLVPAILFNVIPMQRLNQIYKLMASTIRSYTPNKTIDLQIYDNKRLFRIPNTKHESSHLYKIPLTYEELCTLSCETIKELAKQKRELNIPSSTSFNSIASKQFDFYIQQLKIMDKEFKKSMNEKGKKTLKIIPYCIQHLLDHGAMEGQRNISIACLASFYAAHGESMQEAIDLIKEWNSKNLVPTGEAELEKTVKSIYRGQKNYGCSTLKLISSCDEAKCKLKGGGKKDDGRKQNPNS